MSDLPNGHFAMQQRRKLHETVNEIIRLDPDYTNSHGFVKGWVLVVDLSGLTPEDDENTIVEGRGQPWADIAVYCSDATGETDLPVHSSEGLLRYTSAHYEDIYSAMEPPSDDE